MRSSFNAIRRGYCVVTGLRVANAEVYPRLCGRGAFDVCPKACECFSKSFKGQKGHFNSIMIFSTPRYIFKAFPLFVGKFQPFEFKTDFSVFSALILSSPVFKVTTR